MKTGTAEWKAWIAFDQKMRRQFGRNFCRRCADKRIAREGFERYCMGSYAGTLCCACWEVDGLNHDRAFSYMDAGESYDEDY